jgi:hypothetical protein
MWQKYTDVSELLSALIIRVVALMMEAVAPLSRRYTSPNEDGAASQKTSSYLFIFFG